MAYSATLRSLLCTTRDTEALLLAFVESFDALVVDPSSLSAAEVTCLDKYADGVVGYDDRDYWLDWIIGRDWSITERLPFAAAAPTTKDESDPLGLFGAWANVIVVDPLNTAARYVSHAASNPCYTDVGRTIAASPANLFTSNSASPAGQYNLENTIWGDARSLVGDSGSSTRFRFPKDGAEVVVYFRGGTYELAHELTFIKEDGAAIANSRIIIRNYPGEVVDLRCGNSGSSVLTFFTISRPDLSIHLPMIRGRRGSVGSYVFAPLLFSITNAADRFRMSGEIANVRAIAPTHPDAGTLPGYVDSAFASRTLDSDQTTGKMLNYIAIQIGLNNVDSVLEDLVVTPAGDDFPVGVSVPGGSTQISYGDTIDIAGTTGTIIRRCTVAGTSSHGAIRVRASGGVTPSGLVIEYNDLRNPENSVLLLSNVDDSIVRYNRVHDWANRSYPTFNDGYGITPGDGHGNEITDNVIWLGDTQGGDTNYGITVQVSQSDVTTEWTDNLIARNIIYRCGIFLGYSSGTMAVAPGRITLNIIEDNIIDGISDYHLTDPNADGPIVLNLGPHTSDFYTNVIRNNILRQHDADTTVVVEKVHPSTFNDHPVADQSPWLIGNESGDPEFADPDAGAFTMRNASPGFALMDAEAPLVDTDLSPDPYDCSLVLQYFPRVNLFGGSAVEV